MALAHREIALSGRYLLFPVTTGQPQRTVHIVVDGQEQRLFHIELAAGAPDFWVSTDMQAWVGKTAVISVEMLPEGAPELLAIACADDEPWADEVYTEVQRPLFHFTARRGWLNDPNGLVYYDGEYHLFFQHNPYGINWENMHWGHAVSRDLVHWRELPIALYPFTQAKGHCYSGSAAVDYPNTAGFQVGNDPTLVAAFTDTERGEVLAYSHDRGRSWTIAEENPIVQHPNSGRDPRIFWYAPGQHWVMAVYEVREQQHGVALLTSPDLKRWEHCCWIDGIFECPDLFPLPLDGNPEKIMWMLCGADGNYRLGDFDGSTFTPITPMLPFQYGNIFYATQTYNGIPDEDGRRIQITWGQSATPGMPFNQCMLAPVELSLRSTPHGPRVSANPVRELDRLHGQPNTHTTIELPNSQPIVIATELPDAIDLQLALTPATSHQIRLILYGMTITYDSIKQMLYCGECAGPLIIHDGRVQLRLLRDRSTLEIFGNAGELYMPMGVQPNPVDHTLSVTGDIFGTACIDTLAIYEMHSIWDMRSEARLQ